MAARELTYVALFAALISLGAFIAIPIGTVPFTLQVLFVLMAGMVLGPRLAALSTLVYLALGLVAPVYAGGASGFAVLFGPTGGFLWGFVWAALLTGTIATRGSRSLARFVVAGLAGLVPIYILGVVWLAFELRLGIGAALAAGFFPFVWVDVLKAVAAGFAARGLVNLPLGLPLPQRDR